MKDGSPGYNRKPIRPHTERYYLQIKVKSQETTDKNSAQWCDQIFIATLGNVVQSFISLHYITGSL